MCTSLTHDGECAAGGASGSVAVVEAGAGGERVRAVGNYPRGLSCL